MRPVEARVCIVENNVDTQDDVVDLVKKGGGRVVHVAETRQDACGVVQDPRFPDNVGDANVLVIGDNLGPHDRCGIGGSKVFYSGHERGVLTSVDVATCIGAVAISCTSDDRLAVARATGGNIDVDTEGAATHWAELLEPHPAEPHYLDRGILARETATSTRLGTMIRSVIDGGDDVSVGVHALSVTGEVKGAVAYANLLVPQEGPLTMSLADFVAEVHKGRKGPVDSHAVKAVVEKDGYLYVITHERRHHAQTLGDGVRRDGKIDRIPVAALLQIPDTYWKGHGLERPLVEAGVTSR